ncbi:MAG: hypothetical protein H8D56_20535 [Planctomycetes bacterium]|nr:hypothetical protein [Planctomycetota bacterium]
MKNTLLSVLVLTIAVAGCRRTGEGGSSQPVAEAIVETLTITSTENGTVDAEEQVVIANELRWSVIIRDVVEEGTIVKDGELIIEFECKALEDAIDQKILELNSAELALEQAKKDLVMAEKQHAIYIEEGKNGLKNAEDVLERYDSQGGEREKSLTDADRLITMSEKTLKIEQERLDFKKTVNEDPNLEKPYSDSELESDELAVENLKNNLEKAEAAKKLLIKYDVPQQIRQLTTTVKEAKLTLEKAELSQEAELKWKAQEIASKETSLKQLQKQMEELREDEANLKVTAERAGLVLYNPGWKGDGLRIQIKEGEEIYPRQKLMEIPDMTTLRIRTMLFEALREYVTVAGGHKEHKVVEAEIEAYIGEAFKDLITRVATGTLPKEQFESEAIKIKTDGIIPKIKQTVIGGRMTKEQAKRFYERLNEQEAEVALQMGGTPAYIEIDWDELPDVSRAQTASGQPENQQGTQAIVVLDAFAQKRQIMGRIVESSPLPKNTGPEWLQTGTKAYDLYVAVDWEANGLIPGKNLRPGMGGKVTLILDEIENALTIPVLSVYNKKDKYFCMKLINGDPTETEITLGKMNESRVQVLSGLSKGDKVLLVAKADEGIKSETSEDEGDIPSGDTGIKEGV